MVWAAISAKLLGGGSPVLDVELDNNRVECCSCDGDSTESPQPQVVEPPALEYEETDVTAVPSELQSHQTIPPPGFFDGPSPPSIEINITHV